MPGKPPPDGPDDRTVLYALPEDQPDTLSEGHKSNQADLDVTPAEKEAASAIPAAPKAKPESGKASPKTKSSPQSAD